MANDKLMEVATEYIVLWRNGGHRGGTVEYIKCRQLYCYMQAIAPNQTLVLEAIRQAAEAYDILTPESPA